MVRFLEHVILIIYLTCSLNCIAQDETKDPFGLNELPAIKAEDKTAELLAKDKRPGGQGWQNFRHRYRICHFQGWFNCHMRTCHW